MNAERILYRTRQFWHAFGASPSREDLELVRSVLSPPLMELFSQLAPDEQAHSINVLKNLLDQGENHPDLAVAALLHDVGKVRCPLRLWERVVIVIGKALFPGRVEAWGAVPAGSGGRLRRPFIVARQHPAWGAEMAARVGASPLAAALIRRHQDKGVKISSGLNFQEDNLLLKLKAVDDES